MQLIRGLRSGWIFAHPKPHLTFYVPVNSDVHTSGINVPKHFTVILYGKLEYSFKQKNYKDHIYNLLTILFNFPKFLKHFEDSYYLSKV